MPASHLANNTTDDAHSAAIQVQSASSKADFDAVVLSQPCEMTRLMADVQGVEMCLLWLLNLHV